MYHTLKKIMLICALALMTISLSSCGGSKDDKNLMLHLAFDEGEGVTVKDSAGKLPDAELNYEFTNAVYTDSQDPQWRRTGISNGCLLLDGSSTYLNYNKADIAIGGKTLTLQTWIAPRMFEWDDPDGAENGNDSPTGIISQSSKEKKQGILLGYERYGRLTFQVGTGSDWITVWSSDANLERYTWNLVTATFDSDAGEMCLYLNGELVGTTSIPKGTEIAAADKKSLLIGRNGEAERLGAGFLNVASGYIDELKIYDTAFSAEDISEYYASVSVPEIEFSEIWLQNILGNDYTRPQYHGGPYQFWMNEPHAPVYYNGMYHLFFQENMTGSYWRNICWGHLVSTDMVNWTQVKEAIVPTENSVVPDGVWSGGAALDKNGVPLLFFTAGNDSFREVSGLISNQNIGVAYPSDLSDPQLIDWVICDELAVIQQEGQGRAGEFRDPHIWKEGDVWCMLICSGSAETTGGTALLYTTDTLELMPDGTIDMDWQYKGPVYEMENQSATYGTSWELPIILPVTNEAGTITKYFFSISPAPASLADNKIYYWIGDFDLETGKFTPDQAFEGEPHLLDYGANVFTGPSCLVDPVSGETYMFSIMQDQRSAAEEGISGWAHTVGLARHIWLNDEGTDLCMEPVDALQDLEKELLIDGQNLGLEETNEQLASVDEDMFTIRMDVDVSNATMFEIDLLQGGKRDITSYTYNVASGEIVGFTENKGDGCKLRSVSGSLDNDDGILSLEIYVDRSLVEAFFENSKSISMRSYPEGGESHGISLSAEGDVSIVSIQLASMGSIFEGK